MNLKALPSSLGLAALAALGLFVFYAAAAPKFSDWSAPVNLGPVVNSAYVDGTPVLSKDGLSLYFQSDRPGGIGAMDIWVSRRATRESPWGTPANLGPAVNTPYNDGAAALSRDGHLLFFNSNRPGGLGGFDIWVSYRVHTDDDFAWQSPVNLGEPVNSAAWDSLPWFFENDDGGAPQLYFASNRPGGLGGPDIYVSELGPGGVWGPPVLLAVLNSPVVDWAASIRHDGLELFFQSDRPGFLGGFDLFVSTRNSTLDPWSAPVNLGPTINTAFADNVPSISADGLVLLFASNRPGGYGGVDLYMSTRNKLGGPQ